ncbi:MAG: acetylornithine deacetylase/succinyl-diaminopimelate desuccinylase family protein [Pseudomonadota bacterium]
MTLSNRIDAKREDLIALLQDLIRFPTLNPPGADYRAICDYLDARFKKHGFETQLVRATGHAVDTDTYPRWNIVARKTGSNPGETVHFNSHVDVVAVGAGWTRDPFGGALEGDLIYGRGSCDMKGGLATSIIAAEAFIEEHPDFNGAVEISATADEESGGYAGVAHLAELGFFHPDKVQHVIIPEPFEKNRICLGHRGGWWAEIETKGEIAHGCMPFLGNCAVRHMGAVLDAFEQTLFPALAARTTQMPVVPEGARSSTMNYNSLHGGQEEQKGEEDGLPTHCVPDSCRIVIDRRFLIEETLDGVRAEVLDILDNLKATRTGFDYDIRDLNTVLPSMTAPDAPVVRTVGQAISDVLGVSAEHVASPGTYDQKHVDRIGGLKNCIAYGPGILEMAHKPDEYISVTDMLDTAKVMGRSLEILLK